MYIWHEGQWYIHSTVEAVSNHYKYAAVVVFWSAANAVAATVNDQSVSICRCVINNNFSYYVFLFLNYLNYGLQSMCLYIFMWHLVFLVKQINHCHLKLKIKYLQSMVFHIFIYDNYFFLNHNQFVWFTTCKTDTPTSCTSAQRGSKCSIHHKNQ